MNNDSHSTDIHKPVSSLAKEPGVAYNAEVVDTKHADVADSIAFFRTTSSTQEMAAVYAKSQAQQNHSTSIFIAWAQAAQWTLAGWALLPVAIAGALTWVIAGHVKIDRILFVGLSAAATVIGINLLRGAARDSASGRIAGTDLRTFLAARVAAVVLLLAAGFGGINIARWVGTSTVLLSIVVLALCIGYALIPAFTGALPGDELVPALALGIGLFLLTLQTQHFTHSVVITTPHTHTVQVVTDLFTRQAWFIAAGLSALFLAGVLTRRLQRDDTNATLSSRAILGDTAVRWIAALSIIVAYVFVISSGLPRGSQHGVLAVLLSLPMAIIPLSGVLSAKNAAAFQVVIIQVQRLVWRFGLTVLGGLLLGGIYLTLLSAIHKITGNH